MNLRAETERLALQGFALADCMNREHPNAPQPRGLKGQSELAERLESERQSVEILIGAIDATVNRLLAQELAKIGYEGGKNAAPSA